MRKIPHGFRLATLEERPAFMAARACILIRMFDDDPEAALRERGWDGQMRCPDPQIDGTGGFCLGHARWLLDPSEWKDPEPMKQQQQPAEKEEKDDEEEPTTPIKRRARARRARA